MHKPNRRRIGRAIIPSDEPVIIDRRPTLWMPIFRSCARAIPILLFAFLVRLALAWSGRTYGFGTEASQWIIPAAILLIIALCLIACLDWLTRRYILTERRAILVCGILHQAFTEVPLSRVQHIVISKPFLLRLLNLGHIGLSTAGSDGLELVWHWFPNPESAAAHFRNHASEHAS